jgi:hypothetical protein
LEPGANAQNAEVCSDPGVAGITHMDNEEKDFFSGVVTFGSGGDVTFDVTVVSSNNDQESSYYYTGYSVTVAAEDTPSPSVAEVSPEPTEAAESAEPTGSPAPTEIAESAEPTGSPAPTEVAESAEPTGSPAPTEVAESAEPTGSPAPTISALPTFMEKCMICPEGQKVGAPGAIIEIEDMSTSCGELEETAEGAYVPPALCPQAQEIAAESCDCTPIDGAAPDPTETPVAAPVTTPTEAPTEGSVPTAAPSISPAPSTSGAPTTETSEPTVSPVPAPVPVPTAPEPMAPVPTPTAPAPTSGAFFVRCTLTAAGLALGAWFL